MNRRTLLKAGALSWTTPRIESMMSSKAEPSGANCTCTGVNRLDKPGKPPVAHPPVTSAHACHTWCKDHGYDDWHWR